MPVHALAGCLCRLETPSYWGQGGHLCTLEFSSEAEMHQVVAVHLQETHV